MKREELYNVHKETCAKCFDVLVAKNKDYSGVGDDPFANFRISEVFGVPAEIGVLMRCTDKFKRIESFVKNGALAVKNESAEDACEDVINYMVILKGMFRDRAKAAEVEDGV